MPDLPGWPQLRALLQGTHPDAIRPGIIRIACVYRCAAVRAEGVGAFVTAFGRFDVCPGSSGSQNEISRERLHVDSIRGAGESLAISAVTYPHSFRSISAS